VQQGQAADALLDTYSAERVRAARENIAFGAKSTEFMAPPHRGFALMREAALRLALESPAIRSLINPRQTSPLEYANSALNHCDGGGDFADDARAGMPAPEARLGTLQGPAHLTTMFGSGFAVLYFDAGPPPPAWLMREADVPRAGAAALRLLRIAPRGAPDAHTVIDELGQAWRRYDAKEGTLYLIRPDGYVMGRWRDASATSGAFHQALARALETAHE
jgi:3-(3-hydroxy-phenyl)propionate hydroxylase